MDLGGFSDFLKVVLQIAQVVALIYAGYKFTRKPHDTLETKHDTLEKRVNEHEVKIKEIEQSLHHGNDKFKRQNKTNKAFITIMLAFVDFEISYCYNSGYDKNEDLLRAKKLLQDYLSDDENDEEI